jgi:RNase adaptor protein for sRNA GlmZ degradation
MYATLKRAVAMYPGPVAINCTGGKHRSVYLADRLAEELQVPVYHRDLNKED